MTKRKPMVFELLTKAHNRSQFDCGVKTLNEYLKTRSGQELKRNISFPYIMTFEDESQVRGFYTLSASSVLLNDLPPELAKVTRYDFVPAVLIGRLALDKSLHGKGYGQNLLIDALRRISRSKDFAVMLVIVEAKDQQAVNFYTNYGFEHLEDSKRRMYIPFKTIEKI